MSVETEIAELVAILSAGAASTLVDGQKVTWDLDQVRRRLRELRRRREPNRRPRIAAIGLSKFWEHFSHLKCCGHEKHEKTQEG